MAEKDPDPRAYDNFNDLRGRNPYHPMSERFRLTEELENARYQNNLLTEKCRQLEMERDEARRSYCWAMAAGEEHKALNIAQGREWRCFNTPEPKVDKTLKGVIIDGGKAVPPKYEDLDNG